MGCRGVLFALSADDEAGLLHHARPKQGLIARLFGSGPTEKERDHNVLDFLTNQIEERWEQDWLCETDKAWDAMHRCLSGGNLDYEWSQPEQGAILGGERLYWGIDYVVSYKSAESVNKISEAIVDISDNDMAGRYDALNEDQYGYPKSEEDREYTVEWFSNVRKFYGKAALAGRPVVFTADQ